ncbi:helix-turn-helix domain-containing protein [Mycolicibacterium austroafricanum]|uniref:helix-turn-helix domain-containing protein n=1 Tax=Mycolicibacterium austroafricanum TaxID=39687 RepID=UPI001CA34D78|nr:helix-turn-helix domain-containing protein [Mycolicibacterium austroafricanum]QZT61295.1 XRE family transcriptional regulator [Mycolicibacterium austroafricanum]
MSTPLQKLNLGEVYMEIRDRKKLARLMIVQEETQRSLSAAAGWRSHSYLGRLLRGEAKTLDTDAALRIAHKLRVPVDDLFVVRVDSNPGVNDQRSGSTAA